MNKKLLIALSVLIVVAIVVGAFVFAPHTSKISVATTSPILHAPATSTNSYEYVEDKPYYLVSAEFPATVTLTGQAGVHAQATMEQWLADDIARFKTDSGVETLTPADAELQGISGDIKYTYEVSYDSYQGANTASYVFTLSEYTLGAHGNVIYRTFVFNKDGTVLGLADLFKPGSAYLTRLSSLAYDGVAAQLKEKLDGEDPIDSDLQTIHDGTKPDPLSFQAFYIDGTNLHLLFPPYQVAAYAAGVFDVSIPLSQLQDILK